MPFDPNQQLIAVLELSEAQRGQLGVRVPERYGSSVSVGLVLEMPAVHAPYENRLVDLVVFGTDERVGRPGARWVREEDVLTALALHLEAIAPVLGGVGLDIPALVRGAMEDLHYRSGLPGEPMIGTGGPRPLPGGPSTGTGTPRPGSGPKSEWPRSGWDPTNPGIGRKPGDDDGNSGGSNF